MDGSWTARFWLAQLQFQKIPRGFTQQLVSKDVDLVTKFQPNLPAQPLCFLAGGLLHGTQCGSLTSPIHIWATPGSAGVGESFPFVEESTDWLAIFLTEYWLTNQVRTFWSRAHNNLAGWATWCWAEARENWNVVALEHTFYDDYLTTKAARTI